MQLMYEMMHGLQWSIPSPQPLQLVTPELKDCLPVLFITALGVFSSVSMQCDDVLTPQILRWRLIPAVIAESCWFWLNFHTFKV